MIGQLLAHSRDTELEEETLEPGLALLLEEPEHGLSIMNGVGAVSGIQPQKRQNIAMVSTRMQPDSPVYTDVGVGCDSSKYRPVPLHRGPVEGNMSSDPLLKPHSMLSRSSAVQK